MFKKRQRKSMRLNCYDYSKDGYYFVTICTFEKINLFGDIIDGEMVLNGIGKIVNECWMKIPNHFSNVKLDEYVIMPNHFHGIIVIVGAGSPRQERQVGLCHRSAPGAATAPVPTRTIGGIVAFFKCQSTKKINKSEGCPGRKIWQRGYHDRVIRSQFELEEARKYIYENPLKWELDPENPDNRL